MAKKSCGLNDKARTSGVFCRLMDCEKCKDFRAQAIAAENPPEPAEEVAEETKEIVVVPVVEGQLMFDSHLALANAAAIAIQTKLAPPGLIKEGKAAVMAALLACKQFNLPQKSMNQMAYVKDRLTFYGYLVQGIAEKHPNYGEKREYLLDGDQEMICVQNKNLDKPVWAAVVEIRHKDSQIWNQYFFTKDEAEKANLFKNSVWTSYTKDMLLHKVRKRALSAEYASALEGIDYHEDVVEALSVSPTRGSDGNASALNTMIVEEGDDAGSKAQAVN